MDECARRMAKYVRLCWRVCACGAWGDAPGTAAPPADDGADERKADLGEPQKLERTRKDGMNRPPRFGRARGGIGARPWSHSAPAGVWDRHAVWDRRAAVSERAGGMRAPAQR